MKGIEQAKLRMAASDEILTNRLREFTQAWCPSGPCESAEFRRDLMTLMVSALENRSEARLLSSELYASAAMEQAALRPLAVIMEKKS